MNTRTTYQPFLFVAALVAGTVCLSNTRAEAHEADHAESAAITRDQTRLASTISIPWTDPSGGRVAIGYENGSWGGVWTQGLRIFLPIWGGAGGETGPARGGWGFNIRGLALQDYKNSRYDFGGRFEVVGMSPILLNFIRIYGGGGVQVFAPVAGVDDKKVTVGGGGQAGFEFFYGKALSMFIEVGGNSGSQGNVGSGATVMAGLHLYPFSF